MVHKTVLSRLIRIFFIGIGASVVITFSAAAQSAGAQDESPDPPGFNPERHMRMSELQPGQFGYGLTVFAGTEPEPFLVQVKSIERGETPGKAVVWMQALDPRFELGGAAQGMSGSPIFIWNDGDKEGVEHNPGEGGKMIGALAYVYSGGRGAYFGVQPIELMLQVAGRSKTQDAEPNAAARASAAPGNYQTLKATLRLADQMLLDEDSAWRLHALARITGQTTDVQAAWQRPVQTTDAAEPVRLSLPLMVSSPQQARWLAPLMEPFGLTPAAVPSVGSLAPHWLDKAKMTIRPGAVLTIPLAIGPIDLTAQGTVTDVLPDGTVLAFGHDFFAQGPIAVPMAGGYIHFVQPRNTTSFKLGGSGPIAGAIVRDETSAIVGRPDGTFETAPVTITVDWPGEENDKTYEYQVVRHETLLASLVGSVTSGSITPNTELPDLNTMTVDANINFEGGRTIKAHEVIPNATAGRALVAVTPPVSALTETPYGSIRLESVDVRVTIEPRVRQATINAVTVEPAIARPGETITAHVEIQNFRGEPEHHDLKFKIPVDAPDGRFPLTISGAAAFDREYTATHPHLNRISTLDELFDSVQETYNLESTGIYGILRLPQGNNLAIGRTELPELPSSRIALLAEDSSTRATPYLDTVEAHAPHESIITNLARIPVTVQAETIPE